MILAQENERLEEEARKKESKNQMAPSGLPYKAKYERILSAANSAEKISSSNRAYGCGRFADKILYLISHYVFLIKSSVRDNWS